MNNVINTILLPFKKSKTVPITFALTILNLVLVILIHLWISFQNKVIITYDQSGDQKSQSTPLFIAMEIPLRSDGYKNCWQEENGLWGSQYDIYIHNDKDFPFVDWILEMSVPEEARIDSSWNGEYTQKSGKIVIKGNSQAFTLVIPGHNNAKMGFVLYTKELLQNCDFHLTGRFIRNPLKTRLFLTALIILSLLTIIFIVTIVLFFLVRRQANIDNQKIESLIKLCARFIDVKDEYTIMHSSHVGYYAKKIAEKMGFNEDFQKNIYYMGMMHDVGKVLIPREILCKASNLDSKEWQEMKKHTIYGSGILEGFTTVPGIKEAALYHHERYDGTGYPLGLKGEEIPIQARIIGVADAYDAMHTNRSYRLHLSEEEILDELERNKGSQFDPKVADAMISMLKTNTLKQPEAEK